MDFDAIEVKRLNGTEEFHHTGDGLGFTVRDFWSWSASDLVSNATRGILAEYIVGRAVGAEMVIRDEWGAYDLKTPGGIRIEVKSAAFLQSWSQKKLSPISFNYAKHYYWDPDKGEQVREAGRCSDVYVFALLAHTDKNTVNPLDLSQWEFYVVPTVWINTRERSQHSITLASLKKYFTATSYSELAGRISAEAEMLRKIQSGEMVSDPEVLP